MTTPSHGGHLLLSPLSRPPIFASVVLVTVAIVVNACGPTRDAHEEEGALLDTRENVAFQGLIDCSARTDTGYSAGDAFVIDVVTVDGKPVEVATADAYWLMQQAAATEGVELRIVSGFRTMDQQEYLYGCYVNCNCNSCNLAAAPGYSNHQSGHALDLNTSDAGVLAWLDSHGEEFGFARTVPSEAWHWEWWGGGPGGGPCSNQVPRGILDAVSCEGGAVGWAQDPDSPDAAVEVHIYLDGPAGSGARGFGGVIADVHRDDLCSAIGSCAHGYSWQLPPAFRDGQPHTVSAYALDTEGGASALLGSVPSSFTCAPLEIPLTPRDGVKRHATSPDVLAAWGLTFDDVTVLAPEVVDEYQTTAPWPGAPRTLQADGDPRVSVLDDDGSLRHVTDPQSLAAWALDTSLVELITREQLAAHPEGPALPAAPFLFRAEGRSEVYMLDARGMSDERIDEEHPPDDGESPTEPDTDATNDADNRDDGDDGDDGDDERAQATFAPSVSEGGCAQASATMPMPLALLAILLVRRRSWASHAA